MAKKTTKSKKITTKASTGNKKSAPKVSAKKTVSKTANIKKTKAPLKKTRTAAAAGRAKPVSLSQARIQTGSSSNQKKLPPSSKPVSLKEAMKAGNSIRMFQNPLLEKLSHVHPLTPLFLYIPVISFSIYYYFFKENPGVFAFLIFYGAGAFFWTIAEYVVHRFLFHPPYSDSHLRWLYFYTHGVHHEAPNDATRLVMPPGASIPLAIMFFFIFKALLPDDYLGFFAGFVSGYLVYDFLHFSTHFFTFEWNWFKKLRKHHNVHHFNDPGKNFGVSNSLWDYIFFTKYRSNT